MNQFFRRKFLIRLIFVYLLQLMLKGFDYTFGHFLDITLRGVYFTIAFVSFWMIIWYLAEYINRKIAALGAFLTLVINFTIGFLAALIANHMYRLGDIFLFDNSHIWEEISFLNPEFTISLLLVYMLIFSFHEYSQSIIKIKEEQLKSAKLEKENLHAQLLSLKAQIEPHFLFNSLSVLSSLIHSDADLASVFVVKLSKTLRYFIEKNKFTLVSLKEELQVVNDYFFLLKTRFGNTIQLINSIDENTINKTFIPPASVQILLENAIKHNKQTAEQPNIIKLSADNTYITIQNTINKRQKEADTTGIGLSIIRERFKLITDRQVQIFEEDGYFTVRLPIFTTNQYESINN